MRIPLLLLMIVPSIAAPGQQNPGSWDCSDLLAANSSQCAGQTSGEGNQRQDSQMQAYPLVNSVGQTKSPNENYSDVESFSRQTFGRNQQSQPVLPQEPLTEFQKFVASSSGQVLPIFGADLFRRVPSTFAPLDMTPVPSDYVIGPGDELRVRIWGQVSFQANLRVDRSGEVYIPQVGPAQVAGIPFSALAEHLRAAIGRVYHNFDLTVDVGQIRAIQVYVSGQARRPGVYTVSALSTLVDTLFTSGGPSTQGSMRHIQLRRGNAVVTDFDLYDLLIRGDKSKDMPLQSGDVLFIPPSGPAAAVTGSVRNPAIYELRANETLGDLFANAGGVTSVAAEARVSIERVEDHRDRHAMEVAYDAGGLATPAADGDLIHVFSIVPLYRKTVIVRGNIANPGRFAWHSGMRISDLIPDKESLITRDYWWKRAQLGLPAPEFEPTTGFADMHQPRDNYPITLKPSSNENNATDQYGLQQHQPGMQRDQYGVQQNEPGPQHDQPRTQQNQNLSAQQLAGSSSLAAQQDSLAPRIPAPAQRTQVRVLAPELDWNYAVVERLDSETLKTTLVPFDLGKLVLQHDASQDIELQAGDVVSIFSEADIRVPIAQQTKLVTLSGEFAHAGVYTVEPGETFRHLVERAGGITPNAYLYGSEFTRESTRVLQQAKMDEYLQTLSLGIQHSNLALAASPASSAQDLASGAATQNNAQQLLASLKQIRATGRIVLRFDPDSSGTSSLPDISLEDGDRFTVPAVPATVNVVGAVYDQNSFLFAKAMTIGDYLRMAGGPNRDADRRHQFIIRADGEVASHKFGNGLRGNEFNRLSVNPGDTIVVPEKTFKPSALRGVLDWTQIFSQLAFGAAAINAIK